jgi:predicted ATPase/DNA-binding winged helix-turn-helix (wHTH) protein/tetratricopeptide (TPR) repeat protein
MAKREHEIGRYRLQPGRALLADGLPVSIGVKALDILTILVEAGGDLVTKSELMDRVWPGVVVEEHNIQVHISALRKVLGSDAGWILTVPRLGYRFAGPVKLARPEGAETPALPRPPGRLFGREQDLAAILSLLDRARLLTLAGPGGIGKTSLGLEIARLAGPRYREGTVFVDLSVLQEPSLVASQVATALGIELRGETAPAELIARRLKPRQVLILLDNCEHVVDAVAPLAELILAAAPAVSLLATSREPLSCVGEQVYRLPLLPVPSDGVHTAAEALATPAVALLVARLQAADLRFELTDGMAATVGAICRRLDGLPLAIEMVGALAPGLGLAAVAARLEELFRLPSGVIRTAAPRHRSLEATLDWSHALLAPVEQVMLRRLAIFPGPFSLDAVEAVISDDALDRRQCGAVLAGLVRKSLVSIDPAVVPSPYRLLETIRTYAGEKLDAAGERHLLQKRHAGCLASILARSMRDSAVTADGVWLDRYGWLIADLRAALSWSFGPDGDTALGGVIVGHSRPLWQMLNLDAEGRGWAERAAATLTPDAPDSIAAHIWFAVGVLAGERSFDRSTLALRRAAELFGRSNEPIERGAALARLGQMSALSGEAEAAQILTEARQLLESSIDKRRLGTCATGFGILHTVAGSYPEARMEHERARTLFQAAGAKRLATAAAYNVADTMWSEGALVMAIETMREALDLARSEGNRAFSGIASGNLAGMLIAQGDIDGALAIAQEAVSFCREEEFVEWLFPHLALLAAKSGRLEEAARLWGYIDRIPDNAAVHHVNEQRALDALAALLRGTLNPARLEQMRLEGRYLDEDQAVALAFA